MKKNASSQSTFSFVRFNVLTGLFAFLCTASAQAHESRPHIAPIHTKPAGQTYGRWAAEWWQWALGVPAAVNPLTDTTGEHCAQRQVDKVWFLAGSLVRGPVVRDCEVPAGKSLFFPLINAVSGAFLNDPPESGPRSSSVPRGAARSRRRSRCGSTTSKSPSRLGSLRAPRVVSRRSSTCSCHPVICSEPTKPRYPNWS